MKFEIGFFDWKDGEVHTQIKANTDNNYPSILSTAGTTKNVL